MADQKPVFALTVEKPERLKDVQKWAACAEALGFPDTSVIEVSMNGHLSVRAFEYVLPWPALSDPDEEN